MLRALPELLEWLRRARRWFESRRPELIEHLKASEWLLDNFIQVERSARQVREDMSKGFYRRLPVLDGGPRTGRPRVYVLAGGMLREANLIPDAEVLGNLVRSFEESFALDTSELWALPVFLRLCALEHLVLALVRICPALGAPSGVKEPTPSLSLDEDEQVARCVRALRTLDQIDWRRLFVECSMVERTLANDPARTYARMDFETRDRCRQLVEEVAWRTGVSEAAVAETVVALAKDNASGSPASDHVGYYLLGAGLPLLERRFRYRPPIAVRARRLLKRGGAGTILWGVCFATGLILVLPGTYLARSGVAPWAWLGVMLLVLVPASTLGLTLVQWLLTNLLPPQVLPKLDYSDGIAEEHRTVVVIPCLLGSLNEVQELVRELELHYLCNQDPQLAFALLTDWVDAPTRSLPGDALLLQRASSAVEELNRKVGVGEPGPFHLLHRQRRWNPSEGVWMGWERKRGKLEELNQLLLGKQSAELEHVVGSPSGLEGVRFVITLDAGTTLPNGSAARLVGTLAHPLNRALFDPESDRVVAGYTVIQPRVEISPTVTERSLFTRIFAGDSAIDIYSRAVSDVYQDLCGEAIYVGKGIVDVAAFSRSLEGRVPENTLLSHDHFEGMHGRAALASDIVLYEDYPPQYLAYAWRLHRWIRGDWQLLPWLWRRVPSARGEHVPSRLSLLGRWVLFENLRRSLLAPALVLMLAAAWLWLPGPPLLWTLLAILAPAGHVFTGLVSGLARGPRRTRVRPWLAGIAVALRRSAGRWLLYLVFAVHESLLVADAIARTLFRVLISHRHLLQWRSAEHTARSLARRRPLILAWSEMAGSPLIAAVLLGAIAVLRSDSLLYALPLLLLWLLAPEVAHRISRPLEREPPALEPMEAAALRRIARRTWHYFETFAGPLDQWLPPDNYQESPRGEVAHRTSPTNIGMYMVSTVAAYDLGWIGPSELLFRLHSTLETLERMETYRGHLYNWYDSRTLEPLLPRYVSTVDSGNLAVALLIARGACADAALAPPLTAERWEGLLDVVDLLQVGVENVAAAGRQRECRRALSQCAALRSRVIAAWGAPATWAAVLRELREQHALELDRVLVEALSDGEHAPSAQALREVRIWLERMHHQLRAMEEDAKQIVPWLGLLGSGSGDEVPGHVLREMEHLLTALTSVHDIPQRCERLLEVMPALREEAASPSASTEAWCEQLEKALHRGAINARYLRSELDSFGVRAQELVLEMDFGLLYENDSRLLRIGYDVSNGRLDPNHYDLLASEARTASLLAIAKGDAPLEHWFFLGRPMTRVQGEVTLLSWGGSMFELLMPALFMESGLRTLLAQSCRASVDEQIDYGKRRGVPWGISESGFYHFDAERNYQYRSFGVPGLGLKRGLSDDLVVAPYASVLALPERPRAVAVNVERLCGLGALGTYGLYEALDFTRSRVPAGERFAVVRSHMSHHQGMVLAAIDNYLRHAPLVRRFHATELAQTVELLLHEQVPVGVSARPYREEGAIPPAPLAVRREMLPWRPKVGGISPQLHLLSNGRMTTLLSERGESWTSWRGLALTRRRLDSRRPEPGSLVYVQDRGSAAPPLVVGVDAGEAAGSEQPLVCHAHMAELDCRAQGLFVRTEVGVAVREDVEARVVTVTNESETTRRLALTSCVLPVLAPAREYEHHPAFSRLFIASEHRRELHALLFRRRLRSPEDRNVVLVHGLVLGDGVEWAGCESDRARFLGRGGTWTYPAALRRGGVLSGTVGAVLDPVGALQCRFELAPGASRRIAVLTAAASSGPAALESARRFRTMGQVDWIFTEAELALARELQSLSLAPQLLPAIQQLTSKMLALDETLRCNVAEIETNRLGKPGLWSRGVSGDLPILLIEVDDTPGARLLSEALLAHRWWRRCGFECTLVLLLAKATSYGGDDEDRLARLIAESGSADWRNRRGGIFVLRGDQLSPEEVRLFRVAARVVLRSSDSTLAQQVAAHQGERDLPPAFVPVFAAAETDESTPDLAAPKERLLENRWGGFSSDGGAYLVHLPATGGPTPAPWCNVLANPSFGCLASESGLGCTWSQNSSERRLTPWRNDPVADEPSEAVYLRDEETGVFWTTTPLPAGDASASTVRHGAGFTEYHRASHGLDQMQRVFVPRADPIKIVTLRLRNLWQRPRRLTVTYYAELVLGALREELAPFTVSELDPTSGTLLARNTWNPEHADRVAFLASDVAVHGVTADRGELLGRRGDLARPAALTRWGLSGRVGAGVDPCFALSVHLDLKPGEEREVSFLFGDGADRDDAISLAKRYRSRATRTAAWSELVGFWDELLGAVEVKTPEPAMDLALNRWLLYQTVASRLEGRTGMYQSSGAFGFRDQLQDVLALVHGAPERAREHVLEAAARQFEEGDVLHWWHPPGARGVRTRCSDDLLWLPFVACHYARATGDLEIFSRPVPFLRGDPLSAEEVERYATYESTEERESLLEHCRRALERGLTRGPHGLPLIGSCDWNDGLNRVGPRGAGESVWLGWFAIATLDAFADVLDKLGEEGSCHWRERSRELARCLEESAWDGAWYRRAWFDDGTALGSESSAECRIDLIAQAWAALCGAADPERVRRALDSAVERLALEEERLVRLLFPPFGSDPKEVRDPGYIRAYPPGVRENGGQYTHAATWLGWAFAQLGDGQAAERIFRWLNPLERGRSSSGLERYRVEPYVVAGDVYSGSSHVGRGGWTWYTGAAAWLWRLGVEAVLGLERVAGNLRIEPCIPPDWPGFEATVRTGTCVCHIVVENPDGAGKGVCRMALDGEELSEPVVPLQELMGSHEVRVTLGVPRGAEVPGGR